MADASPIAIICGGGPFPFSVADAALRTGRKVHLMPIEGWADRDRVAAYPHDWVPLGQYGRMVRVARNAGARDVVFIGTLVRPSLKDIRLDWKTIKILPRIYRAFRGGDDHLLRNIGKIFEDDGFRMLGAHEVAPEILAPTGDAGRVRPSAQDIVDATLGLAVLDAMGPFDVGQAVVVADNVVLAVEAAEGTDRMLQRIAALRRDGRIKVPAGRGVLVKAAKPTQDRRFDLPSIGPTTVANVKDAGLAGIAVRAGEVIVAEFTAVTEAADSANLFVTGLAPSSPP
jgi:UDP-2,3-diacylglucosamine hydrolase